MSASTGSSHPQKGKNYVMGQQETPALQQVPEPSATIATREQGHARPLNGIALRIDPPQSGG
jgi:hypothetical protein